MPPEKHNPSTEEKVLFLAKARQADAEARKAEEEAKKFAEEAETARFQKLNVQLQYDENKRLSDAVLAGDNFQHIHRFCYDVSDNSVALTIATLSRWSRQSPKCDMTIVFNSPGGSIIDGFALYDFLQELKKAGHKITTKANGYAASMAGVLLQAGSTRVMGAESWLLIHEASFGALGKIGAVEDTVAFVKKMQGHILDIYAERAAAKLKKSPAAIRKHIEKNWRRTDWWLSAKEALENGFIDAID